MVCGVRRHGNVRNGGPQVQNLRPAAQRVFQLGKVRLQILAGGQNQARLPCGGDILRSGFKAVQVAVGAQQVRHLHVAAADGAGHIPQNWVQGRDFQAGGVLGLKSAEQAQKTQKRNQNAPEHVPHYEPPFK